MELRKATRKKAKIRAGMSGPSGFGKTYSALLLAKGLVGSWDKIAVIDTENGSADLYSDLGDYNVIPLTPPFTPERYIEAIRACERAGMEVIIVDSISHEWEGKGGCLEIVENLGGKYQNWAQVTPRHQAFVEAITHSSCHMITTVRRKQDYDMVKDGNKTKVEKVGMKEVTREGFEYELTVNFEFLNDKHMVKAGKDRTGLFVGRPEFIITEETGKAIAVWCDQGIEETTVREAIDKLMECEDVDALTALKDSLPVSITKHELFVAAGKKKFAEIVTKKTGREAIPQ